MKKEIRFEEYKKWCIEHNKLPSPVSKDPIEKSLGVWRYACKNFEPLIEFNKRFNKQFKQRRYKSKESRFEEYKKLCLEHHKLPSSASKDPTEKSLGVWKYDHRNWEPLIEFNKQFKSREHKPREFRFEDYKKWCLENNKLPSRYSKDHIEKSLGMWRDHHINWELLRNFNLILKKSVEGDEEAIEIINLLR